MTMAATWFVPVRPLSDVAIAEKMWDPSVVVMVRL